MNPTVPSARAFPVAGGGVAGAHGWSWQRQRPIAASQQHRSTRKPCLNLSKSAPPMPSGSDCPVCQKAVAAVVGAKRQWTRTGPVMSNPKRIGRPCCTAAIALVCRLADEYNILSPDSPQVCGRRRFRNGPHRRRSRRSYRAPESRPRRGVSAYSMTAGSWDVNTAVCAAWTCRKPCKRLPITALGDQGVLARRRPPAVQEAKQYAQAATRRWLTAAEVYDLLGHHDVYRLRFASCALGSCATAPPSGTLLL